MYQGLLIEFAALDRSEMMEQIRKGYPEWEQTLGQATRPLTHKELLNRDYYRGRFASLVNGIHVYNWEETYF
jgi:N,N'-diacetyllegionaminate synthase